MQRTQIILALSSISWPHARSNIMCFLALLDEKTTRTDTNTRTLLHDYTIIVLSCCNTCKSNHAKSLSHMLHDYTITWFIYTIAYTIWLKSWPPLRGVTIRPPMRAVFSWAIAGSSARAQSGHARQPERVRPPELVFCGPEMMEVTDKLKNKSCWESCKYVWKCK